MAKKDGSKENNFTQPINEASAIRAHEAEARKQGGVKGRRAKNRLILFNDRNVLLEALSTNWHRIGWRLSRARSLESLRKALRPLKHVPSLDRWTRYLLRNEIRRSTLADFRATRRALALEAENYSLLYEEHRLLTEQFDLVDAATNTEASDLPQVLWREKARRGDKFEESEHILFASTCRLEELEERFAEQAAYFSLHQLLEFMKRGYAQNPRVLANALAGIPDIGCRRSFTLCSGEKSPQGHSLRYQVFRFIQKTWQNRDRGPATSLVEEFRSAILREPRVVKENDPKGHGPAPERRTGRDNYVRTFLCEKWRYLRLALERLRLARIHPRAVPYVIASRLYANIGLLTTAHDQALAELERLEG